jgi:hypothetical protein
VFYDYTNSYDFFSEKSLEFYFMGCYRPCVDWISSLESVPQLVIYGVLVSDHDLNESTCKNYLGGNDFSKEYIYIRSFYRKYYPQGLTWISPIRLLPTGHSPIGECPVAFSWRKSYWRFSGTPNWSWQLNGWKAISRLLHFVKSVDSTNAQYYRHREF